MLRSIILVEFADPDFNGRGQLEIFTIAKTECSRASASWFMREHANCFGRQRWANQIMRVHRYDANLPALIPSNRNRPY